MIENYFSDKELSCKCCGVNGFKESTLLKLNKLRSMLGEPIILSSAYRCRAYNDLMGFTQTHATGQAGDIPCSHNKAVEILKLALICGFTGIGVKQKGNGRFIHLDDLPELPHRPRPHLWSY